MAETCFLGIPASSAMSARSCSKGARSWSSGSPATVMLASFCSAAAPKAEIADARVRVILEESTEESWRWIHRSEPSTNASKAWTVEHSDGRLGSLPQWSTRARDVMTPVAGGCSPSRACRPPTGATSPQLLPLVGTPDAVLNPSVTRSITPPSATDIMRTWTLDKPTRSLPGRPTGD